MWLNGFSNSYDNDHVWVVEILVTWEADCSGWQSIQEGWTTRYGARRSKALWEKSNPNYKFRVAKYAVRTVAIAERIEL